MLIYIFYYFQLTEVKQDQNDEWPNTKFPQHIWKSATKSLLCFGVWLYMYILVCECRVFFFSTYLPCICTWQLINILNLMGGNLHEESIHMWKAGSCQLLSRMAVMWMTDTAINIDHSLQKHPPAHAKWSALQRTLCCTG